MAKALNRLAGWLLFAGLVLTISNQFTVLAPIWLEGTLLWSAGLILFFTLARKQKRIISTIGVLAIFSWTIAWGSSDFNQVLSALTMNQSMIVMLMGVHFLQLVAMPKIESDELLPVGRVAFLRTYLGVHLFGSVINLSSVMLVADRLLAERNLTNQQFVLLTRAFSSAAFWSPFFAAFAAAMVFTPDASFGFIFTLGVCLSSIAFVVTYIDMCKSDDYGLDQFVGYPMHFQALWLPALLVILVLVAHELMPTVKVILLIAFFSVLISMSVLLIRYGLFNASNKFSRHVSTKLPGMKNELLLFLVAGVFGAGLAAALDGLSISVPIFQFNGLMASLILLVMFLLALIGVHPVISIAVIGHWIGAVEPNQTLLAMMFLMSWGLGVSTSPFSGMNLALQGRYGLSGQDVFKWNVVYSIKMYLMCSATLLGSSYLLGI